MLMMALLPPGGLLGGYAGDPDGVNGSWEKACTYVSTPIRVRVAVATGELARHLPQRLFLACPRPASIVQQNHVHCVAVDANIDVAVDHGVYDAD